MSAPIPSFFKMRLVIVVALVLLCFFFIGLLNRAFAQDCTSDASTGVCGITKVIQLFERR